MWHDLKIEEKLLVALEKQFNETQGKEIYGDYTAARRCLIEDVLPEIKAIEPNLTAHGAEHVADVLKKAYHLLGDAIVKLSGVELYSLCLSTLFHDVGNLLGRDDHNKKICDIFEHVRRGDTKYRNEQLIVTYACGAHCGISADGSKDTLKDVPVQYHLHGEEVRLQAVAALLRFADELAEGQQRTSAYMQARHMYPVESMIFHKYASITNIFIDRGNGRVLITYNIEIESDNRNVSVTAIDALKELIEFTYKRIIKLDQERKYAKHFCLYLSPFKETSVQYNFWFKGHLLNIGLPRLDLSDIVIPGDAGKTIPQINQEYEINDMLEKIKYAANEGA